MLDDLIEARAIEVAAETHPLCRDVVYRDVGEGTTVAEIVRLLDLDTARYGLPYVLLVRGLDVCPVPITLWGRVRPKIGTRVEVAFPAQEGGAVVAAIAAAALPSAAAAGAGALFTAGTVGYALTYAAITVVGALAINALIPPARQSGSGTGPQNYAITGVGNAANRYGVFPYVIGRHRMFPVLTATGYSETVGRDIYYIGRMTFGWAPNGVALEDLRIGTTPITEYSDVSLEFRNVDKARTLANLPGLEALVQPKTEESHAPQARLAKAGDSYVFEPVQAVKSASIAVAISTGTHIEHVSLVLELSENDGAWVEVQAWTAVTSGFTWASADFGTDEVQRAWRLRLTDVSTVQGYDGHLLWKAFSSDGVTVTDARASYQQASAGWRYGSEAMRLYPRDVAEDAYSDVPQQDVAVVKYTRVDTSSAAIDLTFPQGLYRTDNDADAKRGVFQADFQFEYQSTAGGLDEGDWVDLGVTTYEAKVVSLYRVTKSITFAEPGEYAIRITRRNFIDDDAGDVNSATLTAIRSFRDGNLPSHEGIAEVAFRIKATDQLNGQIDSLNAIVQQLVPVWDGVTWTEPRPERHPAWGFLQAIRGRHLRRPVRDERIDLEAFRAWAAEEPHWACDYVVDTATQVGEVLDIIAAAGRAKRTLTDLKWSIIRDNAAGPVRQVFTPRNSWGFKAEHRFPREIHGFRIRARSERLEWQEDEILVLADGFTRKTATELETLELPGVVVTAEDEDEGNIYRLGRYHLATALNRPATYTLQVDWEHLRVTRGDKVRFVHDVPLIGVGQARIKAIATDMSGYVASITLDEVFDFDQDTFRMLVRNVAGNQTFGAISPVDPHSRVWTPNLNVVASEIAVGDLVVLEELAQESVELLVVSVRPKADESAELQLVDAVPAILGADSGTIPPYAPVITSPRDPATAGLPPKPVIISAYSSSLTQIVLPDLSVRPRIAVQLAPFVSFSVTDGTTLQLRWRDAEADAPWTYGEKVSAGEYNLLTGPLDDGEAYLVEVIAVGPDGKTHGWIAASAPVVASLTPPPPPAITLTVTPATVADASGAGRRPAIRIGWGVLSNTTLRVTWQLRVKATGAVMQTGLFAESSAGYVTISEAILPNVEYEVRASFVTGAPALRTWSAWFSVATDDLRFSAADLADELAARIDTAFERHDQALEDVESGTIRELLDAVAASFGPLGTYGGLPLVGAIEQAIGPLTAEVSLSTQVAVERQRLDLTLPRIYELEGAAADIWERLVDLRQSQFATDQRLVDAGIYVDPDAGEVRIFAVEYLSDRMSEVQVTLDTVEATLALSATRAYVNEAVSTALIDPSQLPLLDDITARITSVEATLDAETGRIDLLNETLTVEGGLVTMATVTAALDSLENELTLRATQAELDEATARLSAAEVQIAALPDGGSISQAVEASRVFSDDLEALGVASVAERWSAFKTGEALRQADAQARSDMRAYVDEQDGAIASDVTELRVSVDGSLAQAFEALEVQASEIDASAQSIEQLQVDLASAEQGLAGQAEALEDVTSRVSATEAGFEVEAGRRELLTAAVRSVEQDAEDLAELAVGAAWDRFAADQDARAGVAVALREARVHVDEALASEASERLLLGAALATTKATVAQEIKVRAAADEALAQDIEELQAELSAADGAITGNATAITSIAARVTAAEMGITSVSQEITSLASALSDAEDNIAANASATDALTTRVSSAEGDIDAQAGRIGTLEATLNTAGTGVLARIATIEGAYVTATGAVAAVTSTISASYSSLSAMASATAFAKAQADRIAAGYVWRLNGASVMELVSVASGTTGAKVTARISGDYIELNGLVSMTDAFIATLIARDAFIANLTVDTLNIAGEAVTTEKLSLNAATAYAIAGSAAVTNNSATPTTICSVSFDDVEADEDLGFLGHVSFVLDTAAGNLPNGFEINVLQSGTLISRFNYTAAQREPTQFRIALPISRAGVSGTSPNVVLSMKNMGGFGVSSANLWALLRKR